MTEIGVEQPIRKNVQKENAANPANSASGILNLGRYLKLYRYLKPYRRKYGFESHPTSSR